MGATWSALSPDSGRALAWADRPTPGGPYRKFSACGILSGINTSLVMKLSLVLALAAAFTALVVLPLSVEITGSCLFSAALGFLFYTDYRRRPRPLIATPRRTNERLGLAA